MAPSGLTSPDVDLECTRTMQTEEWEVLESIHPTICVSKSNGTVKLEIPVELGDGKMVEIIPVSQELYYDVSSADTDLWRLVATKSDSARDIPLDAEPVSASLSNLPPLFLEIILPSLYPEHSPPVIMTARASSGWIPVRMIGEMRRRMVEMWACMGGNVVNGGEVGVLYGWVEWIRSGEFLTEIGLCNENGCVRIPHPRPGYLLPLLLEHAAKLQDTAFAQTSYGCGICLTSRRGAHCLRLRCGHVFCRQCLGEMWGLHIREGDVGRVGCPEVGCECDGSMTLVTEEELRAVLTEDETRRWRWLRRKRDLEKDPTTVHCPMEFCQEPVPRAKTGTEDEEESGWTRLRTCDSCGYSFCSFCKRTWHGPHTPCPLPITSKIVSEYLSASATERIRIQQRYGRKLVQRLVQQHEEDLENHKWMEASTTECPGCDVRVEKSMGCNHMTCTKCKTHFCYCCGSKISATNPYEHFSARNSSCFSKLFDYIEEWEPVLDFERGFP